VKNNWVLCIGIIGDRLEVDVSRWSVRCVLRVTTLMATGPNQLFAVWELFFYTWDKSSCPTWQVYFNFFVLKKNQNQKPPTAVRLPPLTRSANHRHSLSTVSISLVERCLFLLCFFYLYSRSLLSFVLIIFFVIFVVFFCSSRSSRGFDKMSETNMDALFWSISSLLRRFSVV
jgi:hypothetical protein